MTKLEKHTLVDRGKQYLVTICGEDYDRAKNCLNALQGIPNPAEFVSAVKALLVASKKARCFCNSLEIINGHRKTCDKPEINMTITRAEKAFGQV